MNFSTPLDFNIILLEHDHHQQTEKKKGYHFIMLDICFIQKNKQLKGYFDMNLNMI